MKIYKSLLVKGFIALFAITSFTTTAFAQIIIDEDPNSADLSVSIKGYLPQTVLEPGENIDVTFTATNTGTTVSEGFDFTIYLDDEEKFSGTYPNEIDAGDSIDVTTQGIELVDDENVTLKVWIQPYNNDENGSNNSVSIDIDLYDDYGSGDLSDCRIAGYGTYYGADKNEELQVGVLNKKTNEPCYDDAVLEDFTWVSVDTSIAAIAGDGIIETQGETGTTLIQATHKDSGEYVTFYLNVGEVLDDRNDYVDVFNDRIETYGDDITVLLEYVENIPTNEFYDTIAINILKAKADVLAAVEALYIKLAEIEAENQFHIVDAETYGDIIEVINYITGANFYETSAAEMIEDLERYTVTISSSLHVLSEMTKALVSDYEDNLEDATEEKFEEQVIPFLDTLENQWFTGYILFSKFQNIVEGYRDENGDSTGYYGPGDNITIAELLKMALESASSISTQPGLITPYTNDCSLYDYPDVCRQMEDHWASVYYKAGSNRFTILDTPVLDPNRTATRAEVITTFLEAFYADVGTGCDSTFDDVDSNTEHSCFIEEGKNLGIISGDDNTNNFRPKDPINRAEVAKIVKKSIETGYLY